MKGKFDTYLWNCIALQMVLGQAFGFCCIFYLRNIYFIYLYTFHTVARLIIFVHTLTIVERQESKLGRTGLSQSKANRFIFGLA